MKNTFKNYVVVYELDGVEKEYKCKDTCAEGASMQAWYEIGEDVGEDRYEQKYIYEE